MILAAIDEAVAAGASLEACARVAGLSLRTLERWGRDTTSQDARKGPNTRPQNALTESERAKVLELANRPEHRNQSPKQIVPKLADAGVYVASESTFYRVLKAEGQLAHRGKAKAPKPRAIEPHKASGPNQLWSWDITYLRANIRGTFFYLYLMLDVWSRKIVGYCVEENESADRSGRLLQEICNKEGVDPKGLVLHSDNGAAMRGATMLATMQKLGIVPSFSRPRVSDDNPYSEALFRTLKYVPEFPDTPFETLDAARAWVERFIHWYNNEHRHSAIRFVTPSERHAGKDMEILKRRQLVYEAARRQAPSRWTGDTRNWNPIDIVELNPGKKASSGSVKPPKPASGVVVARETPPQSRVASTVTDAAKGAVSGQTRSKEVSARPYVYCARMRQLS